MLRYRDLSTSTTDVLDLTSVTIEEFTALVPPFEAAFLDYLADWTRHGRQRQARRSTTEKNCPLPTPEDRLLFILVSLTPNPTPLLHGRLFGMRQSKATPWIQVLLPVWRHTLRPLGDAPSRSVEAWHACLGGGSPIPALGPITRRSGTKHPTTRGSPFGHDGTERPIPRPHAATEQTTCESGKKQRHLLKTLRLRNQALRLLFLSETHPGRVHDKRLAATTPDPLPTGSQRLQDAGFQAFTLDGVDILHPTKKPRGHELTRAQKARNRKLARRRVRIAPVNSRVKRCRMLKETLRMWKAGIRDMVMEIGCALHNFRVRLTPSWTPRV